MPPSSRTRSLPRAPRRWLVFGLSTVLIAVAVAIAAVRPAWLPGTSADAGPTSVATPRLGTVVPPVQLTDVRTGRSYEQATGSHVATLVAFLVTQPDTAATQSRRQAVALVSLADQFRAKGLRVAIVDATARAADHDALVNTSYDWQLGQVALLADPGHRLKSRYGVAGAPTTLLLDGSGRLAARWQGPALTAAITASVHRVLKIGGAPV